MLVNKYPHSIIGGGVESSAQVLDFVGAWGRGFFVFLKILFPICSHHVHKMFPKMFPTAPQFNLILFGPSSTSMYPTHVKGLPKESISRLSTLRRAECSRKIGDGPNQCNSFL
jgi:hypothetical protein